MDLSSTPPKLDLEMLQQPCTNLWDRGHLEFQQYPFFVPLFVEKFMILYKSDVLKAGS